MAKDLFPELDTPSLVVDLDVMERNIRRMAQIARENGVKLRPHIKTHKSPWIAMQQIEHGAAGITAAKLGEAEVMAEAGITDILLAYPIIGRKKVERFAALLREINLSVSLDSPEAADAANRAGQLAGKRVRVYVDVDTGLERLGQPPGEPTLRLALEIAKRPNLEVIGVLAHGGHLLRCESAEALAEAARSGARDLVRTAELLRSAGLPIEEVSPGFTAGAPFEATVDGVTEIRPGTYVFNDMYEVHGWAAAPEDCAASVLAQVVSRPTPTRAVIDAGSKTLARDPSIRPDGGFGMVRGYPDVKIARLSEEHGVLDVPPDCDLKIGDRILIIPNHICPVVNLFDVIFGVQGGRVVTEIPVAARGRRQ